MCSAGWLGGLGDGGDTENERVVLVCLGRLCWNAEWRDPF